MVQTIFTRKNLIAIAISVFYAIIFIFTGACLDGAASFVNKKNPIAMMANSMGFRSITPGLLGYLCLILIGIYIIVMVTALIYEKRYATVNGTKPFSPKMFGVYALTVLLCAALSLGIGILCQKPLTGENIKNMLLFIGQSLGLATGIFIVLALIIGAATMLVVNFINVDKPFKFFGDDTEPIFDDEDLEDADVKSSFDIEADADVAANGAGAGGAGGGGGVGNGEGETAVKSSLEIGERERVFPSLCRLDTEHDGYVIESIESDDITLSELCDRFRNYLSKEEKLYFEPDVIRFFISGFAASHFEILEGLSGTGKSSLPRYFAKFANGRVLFMPVQATWRDKSNILGFFNEFSTNYSETDFLIELYHANYNPDEIHFFVLDEMNISRVEYYFADLLSVLEYPEEDWKLKIMQLPYDFVPPIKLENGFVQIPTNCYFVGTANKDDSTFTITDKVYDRAITMEFSDKNTPFEAEGNANPVKLSASKLRSLYNEAIANADYRMTPEDFARLNVICEYVYEQFGIAIGNRIMNQIDNIVPAFMACGGTKEAAIDFMLSKKLVSKIEGRFEDYVKDALNGLIQLLHKTYGVGVLKMTERVATSIMKTL
ncbi:MAG: hypothetical protein E7641_05975 [Ruminococcaceae bacterium]|nr:hypothetical protein [Oscillospiraceae bacterium]